MTRVYIEHLGMSISDGDSFKISYGGGKTHELHDILLKPCTRNFCKGTSSWKCYRHVFNGPLWCVNENITLTKLIKINKITEVI